MLMLWLNQHKFVVAGVITATRTHTTNCSVDSMDVYTYVNP
jgi:hypothetical protein